MFPRPFFPSRSNNMLYPRENRTEKKLMYVCRRCGYEQEAENPVVFKHELVKSAK
jgi:DNA-directed RNA polymerase II subunit RPB9